MPERRFGQLTFTDGLVNKAARANAPLQRVSELVDWDAVEALLSGLRSGSIGAPTYPKRIATTTAMETASSQSLRKRRSRVSHFMNKFRNGPHLLQRKHRRFIGH
jgi:hypothetical protein